MAERRLTGLAKATKRYAVLGQLRPADTNAASLYSPATNVIGYIMGLMIANTGAGAIAVRVFLDADGTTYDQTTALVYDKSIATADYLLIQFNEPGLPMPDDSGNLAVRTGAANDATFTAWGYEVLGNG